MAYVLWIFPHLFRDMERIWIRRFGTSILPHFLHVFSLHIFNRDTGLGFRRLFILCSNHGYMRTSCFMKSSSKHLFGVYTGHTLRHYNHRLQMLSPFWSTLYIAIQKTPTLIQNYLVNFEACKPNVSSLLNLTSKELLMETQTSRFLNCGWVLQYACDANPAIGAS